MGKIEYEDKKEYTDRVFVTYHSSLESALKELKSYEKNN